MIHKCAAACRTQSYLWAAAGALAPLFSRPVQYVCSSHAIGFLNWTVHAMFRSPLQLEAAEVLDWPKLLEALALHAHSTLGKQRCLGLQVETSLDQAEARQQETTEMAALREQIDSFPSLGFPDIREILARVGKGGWLEAPELRDCSLVLGTIETVGAYLVRHPEAGLIRGLAKPVVDQSSIGRLKRSLDAAILPDGSMTESATPELRRLTHHAQELK